MRWTGGPPGGTWSGSTSSSSPPASRPWSSWKPSYRVTLEAPIAPRDTTLPQAAQALDMSQQLNDRFDRWIRATPGQWMCLARRFPKELDKSARG